MRIGLILSSTPGYSETFLISKIKGLQSNGNKVVLFVQTRQQDFKLCEVKLISPKNKSLLFKTQFYLLIFIKLIWFLKRVFKYYDLLKKEGNAFKLILKKIILNASLLTSKLDWVHFGFATLSLGKEQVPQLIGAKMAVSFRGFDMAIYPIKHPNCYSLLFKNVDKVHTISDDLLQLAYIQGLSKEIDVKKIPPAIAVENFIPNENDTKISNKLISILTVARLHWKKGFIYTLEALSILKKQGLDFHYNIIGSGDMNDELLFTIHQLNLSENVTLLGKKEHHEVIEYYNNASIYIQYSISEGFCNAVLEAQAMRLLCVVSDAEGLSENVLHNETGWVVPKRNSILLSEKLIEIINLPQHRQQQITDSARKRVLKQFNLEEQAIAFQKFYI